MISSSVFPPQVAYTEINLNPIRARLRAPNEFSLFAAGVMKCKVRVRRTGCFPRALPAPPQHQLLCNRTS